MVQRYSPSITQVVLGNHQLNSSVKEPYKIHNYDTEKITRKASDAAHVVWFFHPISPCTTHLVLFSEHLPIYASSCMTISGGRTEQHVVIDFDELAVVD